MNTRRILFLTLLTTLGLVLPLHAQLVSDGGTATLANVTNTITGGVTVGTNGAFTRLVLSDNALLTNSANGVISANAAARSNQVHLVSPSASWLMGGTLFVGSNGPLSTLVVSNGAFVRANNGRIGSRAGSDSNVVVVTGSGSTWSSIGTFVGADLSVGGGGSGNQLIVRNGGRVMGNRDGIVGNNAGTSNNLARVSGSGSIWSNATSLRVGLNGTGNRLVIEAGGLAQCDAGTVGDFGSASNNEALVTGPGSLWTNFSSLTIGNQARGNRLVVSNGAAVKSGTGGVGSFSNQVVVTGIGSVWSNQTFLLVGGASNRVEVSDGGWLACNDGSIGPSFGANNNTAVLTGSGSGWNNLASLIVGGGGNGNVLIASNGATVLSSNATIGVNGSTANNNLAIMTGAGTLWSNRTDLTVGSFGVGNRLQVDNSATVLSGNLFVGFNSISANNRVTVNGGTLRVTNAAGTGVLDVRRGTNVLNGGLMEVDRLLVSSSAGRFEFNGGTLAAGKITVVDGLSFEVGDGVSPAALHLTGNDTHDIPSIVVVRPNATLMGNGFIQARISVQSGARLSPGAPPGEIGRLASSTGSSSLAGTINLQISKNGATLANDRVEIASVLTFANATVLVTNIGPTALAAGDRFQLFTAGSVAGILETLSLPPLAAGLRWVTNLLVDGSIEVESLAPSVTTLPASGLSQTAATLNGVANPKGTSTSAWFEYGFSTNYGFVTPPQALGSLDANANFSETLTALIPGIGYHFRAVASNSFGVGFGADQNTAPAQHDYLKASDTSPLSGFGQLVAMSGDTLVVAGNGVYVFVREGSSWEQQAHFTDSPIVSSVAISGDTLVIAGDDNNSATNINAGAAHVFMRSGTTWTKQAILRKNNSTPFDRFGLSVAISGDTIVVGVPSETHSTVPYPHDPFDPNFPTSGPGINAGTAYVFVRNGTNWSQQTFLRSDHIVLRGQFGSSVAMAGDTIVVGEPNGQSPVLINGVASFALGPAHVFMRNGTDWSHQATLLSGNPGFGVEEGGGFALGIDDFGASIAISDDTVVVGSPREDSNATGVNGSESNDLSINSGAAYVFVRSGTNWTRQAYLKASNTGNNDFFGASVAVSGDRIIIGAAGEDSNARNVNGDGANNLAPGAGAAYVFARQGATWSFQDYLKASNTESNDNFGISVAASADLLVVGASGEDSNDVGLNGDQDDNSATNSGAVYIFGPQRPPAPEITVSHTGTNLLTGASLPQLIAAVGHPASRSVTIKNTGNDFLTGLVITFDGPDAAMFSVAVPPVVPLTPTSNTTFIVRFVPTSGGTKTATLRIASNDENENPFNLQLHDLSLSFTEDRDGDGLNDASELLMASLGFNFQVNQTSLVNTLFNNLSATVPNLNAVGFFTQSQLQALNVDTPLLAKDPDTGFFKLTISVEKSADLLQFLPFPMTAPQTLINAEGKLEFQFSAPDNAAFFRLEAK